MLIFFALFAIQSSITGKINLEGTTITIKSIASGKSLMLAKHFLPSISFPANFGFTPYKFPEYFASIALLNMMDPNLFGFSETPITAKLLGLKKILMTFFLFVLIVN